MPKTWKYKESCKFRNVFWIFIFEKRRTLHKNVGFASHEHQKTKKIAIKRIFSGPRTWKKQENVMKTLKNQISYMDWRYRTVYFYFSGLHFLFFRTFCSRLIVFLVLRAFSALFLAFSFHLQCQKRENTKNPASFVMLSEFSFSKNQENCIKM